MAQGLENYFPDYNSIIINADNGSSDNTKLAFLETDTGEIEKIHITSNGRGKGRNILSFLSIAIEKDIPNLATFDTDLKSIEVNWVKKILSPIIEEGYDYVTPIYKRNRYEGNTTNHLCYPVLKSLFLKTIRQPIAGDFGFSLKQGRKIMETISDESMYQYGIDITMTLTALINNMKIKEVYLGEKIHNPSFGKMIPMFLEVSNSMLTILNKKRALLPNSNHSQDNEYNSIDKDCSSPSVEEINKRYDEIKKLHLNTYYQYLFKYEKNIDEFNNNKVLITTADWTNILKELINIITGEQLEKDSIEKISKELLVFYLARVLSYFEEIESFSTREVERYIEEQAVQLQNII